MNRPSRQQTLMDVAWVLSCRSTCSRASVGVVIVRDGRILSTGYNGAPAGMEHCTHIGIEENGCKIAIHAEANAISYAARYGVSLEGTELFTTFCPCLPCAQLIVAAGIAKVYYHKEYRDRSGLELLKNAGIDIMVL